MNKNQHDIARALNADLLEPAFLAALQKAWCREACWPGCIDGYPHNRGDNPSYGNCLVSVLAAYALRGMADNLIPAKVDEGAWHFRLGISGSEGKTQIDPTWQQFDAGAVLRELPRGTQEYAEVMTGSLWDDESLMPRLAILIEKMKSRAGFDLGRTAEHIIDDVRKKYGSVLDSARQARPRLNQTNSTPNVPG